MTKTQIKTVLFAIWAGLIGLALYWYLRKGISIAEAAGILRELFFRSGLWGAVFYVGVYSLRSLIFFPASVLTMLAGMVFGPWLGILLTVIGENISANISFVVGRYFAAGLLGRLGAKSRFIPPLTCKIRQNGFLSVLIMRLTYLPFDFVGYSSGMCNIRPRDFFLATLIGTLPGLSTFAFLGSSVEDLRYLVPAAVFLILGLGVSLGLKRSRSILT